ncbi:integrase core domain-containing protein [Streptomyces sp. NPDC055400]
MKIPPRCPQAYAYADRFVRTVRSEVTDRMLLFSQRRLHTVLNEYAQHYNGRRPHRGRQLNRPGPTTPSPASLTSGSSAGRSSEASSTSTKERRRDAGHRQRSSSGTHRARSTVRRRGRWRGAGEASSIRPRTDCRRTEFAVGCQCAWR